MYYCNPSPAKKQLLETFSYKPQEFRHQDLISMMENISLLTEKNSEQLMTAAKEQKKNDSFFFFGEITQINDNNIQNCSFNSHLTREITENEKYFPII